MTIGLLIPYFGKLPNTFDIWLSSVNYNDKIDFHLVTDQIIDSELPSNLFVHKMTFSTLRKKIEERLNTTIKTPYKLCDYKPSYGYLFNDILAPYDYWGYSDIDLVYGNLNGIVQNKTIFGVYDKIFELGHLSFYKNCQKVNELFQCSNTNYNFWPYISKSQIVWIFDEQYDNLGIAGINKLIIENGMKLYSNKECLSDVGAAYYGFTESKENHAFRSFYWIKNGNLKRTVLKGKKIIVTELMYAHFQKRQIKEISTSDNVVLILPVHWPDLSSYNEAINFLKLENLLDLKPNIQFYKWMKMRRRRKAFVLFFEFFRYRTPYKLAAISLRNKIHLFRRSTRANNFI